MRCSPRQLVPVVTLLICASAVAQGPTYNLGRTPTEQEIRALGLTITPSGKDLPPGSGTAKEGAKIYSEKCAACHGPSAEGSPLAPRLVGGKGTLTTLHPVKTIGSYWAFATTVWDYINRAMPPTAPGSLGANEVFALTAYLLYRNDIIQETEVLDAKSLPKVRMPNRDGFVPATPTWPEAAAQQHH